MAVDMAPNGDQATACIAEFQPDGSILILDFITAHKDEHNAQPGVDIVGQQPTTGASAPSADT